MPPNPQTAGGDDKASEITALCQLIMSCDEFQPDNEKVAATLGIGLARNVPRKINDIVAPYGFQYKDGKMTLKEDANARPFTAGQTSLDFNPDVNDDEDGGIASDLEPTPAPRKPAPRTPKTPRSPQLPTTPDAPKYPNTPLFTSSERRKLAAAKTTINGGTKVEMRDENDQE